MKAVVEEKDKPFQPTGETVDMGAWVAANLPRLHPTRRKVLTVTADLTQNGHWTTSSKVRTHTGLSQQLLNRHLRALQQKGLLELENQGPGLPLNVMITGAGLRALGLRGPKQEEKKQSEPRTGEPPGPKVLPADADLDKARSAPLALQSSAAVKDDFLSALTDMIYKSVQEKLGEIASGKAGQQPGASPAPARAKTDPVRKREPEAADSSPQPETRQANYAAAFQEVPPELNAAESALENKLAGSAHGQVRDMPWYQRTKQFQNVWDQLRRRHLGQLTTYFNSFGPRWNRLDWADFNTGRRQADARSADYRDWIVPQFDRVFASGTRGIKPSDLHGQEAVQAYMDSQGIAQETKKVSMGPPPYTPETFDLRNPDHVAYADKVLQDMAELGLSIYGDAKEGPIKLVAQAVSSGNFPKAALELRPDWKEKVLSSLRLGHKSSPETAVSTNLGLII